MNVTGSVRYMVQKSKRWTGEEVFKILDKDMGWLLYASYITYEAARDVCAHKNALENQESKDNLASEE